VISAWVQGCTETGLLAKIDRGLPLANSYLSSAVKNSGSVYPQQQFNQSARAFIIGPSAPPRTTR
jgi:hypothetical protein